MQIHIVAGGPVEYIPDLSRYNNESIFWIGVDRGLYYLLQQGITPILGIGDFDSVSTKEFEWMQKQCEHLQISVAEKDQTDIELALEWALEKKPAKIKVFGATGGRLDHELANIQLLYKGLNSSTTVEIIDKQNILSLYKPGTYLVEKTNIFKYISFLPFTNKVQGITLEGFKYPLFQRNITTGTTLCISNEIINESGTFSFIDGILIMVKSKD
jgi:thiamine pyrophosphokinase